jgi:hypothetical protein
MAGDVQRYVASCYRCNYAKAPHGPKKVGRLVPTAAPYPNHTWYVDIKQMPGSGDGHVLVIVDAFSRMTALRRINNMTTREVVDELEEVWSSSFHSLPVIIRSDGGPCFTSKEYKSWCKDNNIEDVIGTAYHAQGQGKVEVRNYYLANALKAMQGGRAQGDWNYLSTLPKLEFALNTTYCEAIGGSPSWAFTGRVPRTQLTGATEIEEVHPRYVEQGAGIINITNIEEIRNSIAEHHTRINAVQELASVAMNWASMQSKKRFDAANATPNIIKGDIVGVYVQPLNNMLPYMAGPYVVTDIDTTNNFISGHGWVDKSVLMVKTHVSRVFKMDMSRTDVTEYAAFTAPPGVAVPERVLGHRTVGGRREYNIKWVGFDVATWTPASNIPAGNAVVQKYCEDHNIIVEQAATSLRAAQTRTKGARRGR